MPPFENKLLTNGLTNLFIAVSLFLCSCNHGINNNPDHTHWADSVIDKAYDLMGGPHPQTAILYLDSISHAKPNLGIGDLWRIYNARTSYYANYAADTLKREAYIDTMFMLLKGRELKYKFEYAHTLFAQTALLQREKKFTQAFRTCFDGRSFTQKNLDDCSLSDFSNYLGIIRYHQGQYQAAIPYLREAYQEVISCGNTTNFDYAFIQPQGILNTTALCFEKIKKPDSAILYYQRALAFVKQKEGAYPAKRIFTETARGVIEGNLGGTYAETGNYLLAEHYLRENIAINDRPEYAIEDAQTGKIKLAGLFIRQSRFKSADTLLRQLQHDLVSKRGKSIDNDEIWEKWYRLSWLFYDRTHQLAQAYKYLQLYRNFSDSVRKVNSGLNNTDVDQAFTAHEQQYQPALLHKNGEVKSAYLVALFIFLVMTAGIALNRWFFLKRSKKHIHELTALNVQMKNTLGALEQSQEENNRIMKVVAHDLRNPIGAMTSMATLLLEEKRSEEDSDMLELIKKSGERSLELVNDLLGANSGAGAAPKEMADMKALLTYCVALLQHKATAKNQSLELQAEDIMLEINQEQMWRVFSNLIANAIKFSPGGAVVHIRIMQDEKQVILSVTDHGIGIPAELGNKIFDLYTEAQRPGTSGETSYGLGLAISKRIVEAHGGKIWYESTPGEATTFYISLPQAR